MKEEKKKRPGGNFANNIVVADESCSVSKADFIKFCDKVRPFLQKQSTIKFYEILNDVEKQLALISIGRGEIPKVTNAFGIGNSTVSEKPSGVGSLPCLSLPSLAFLFLDAI